MFSTRQRSGLSSASTVTSLVRAELAEGFGFPAAALVHLSATTGWRSTVFGMRSIFNRLLRGGKLPLQLLHSVLLGLNHLFYAVKLTLPVVLSGKLALKPADFCISPVQSIRRSSRRR